MSHSQTLPRRLMNKQKYSPPLVSLPLPGKGEGNCERKKCDWSVESSAVASVLALSSREPKSRCEMWSVPLWWSHWHGWASASRYIITLFLVWGYTTTRPRYVCSLVINRGNCPLFVTHRRGNSKHFPPFYFLLPYMQHWVWTTNSLQNITSMFASKAHR